MPIAASASSKLAPPSRRGMREGVIARMATLPAPREASIAALCRTRRASRDETTTATIATAVRSSSITSTPANNRLATGP